MIKQVPVIVIGAGVAGLACSKELYRHDVDHLVIAKVVGGRITSSDNGAVNYGAYIFGNDSRHIKNIVTRGRRLRLHHVRFHGEGAASFWPAWQRPGELWRFYRAVRWFQRHYRVFQHRAERIGQRAALEADRELLAMYQQPARDWLVHRHLDNFSCMYIDPVVRMCTFSEIKSVSALEFFHVAMYLTIPVFEFRTDPGQLATTGKPPLIDEVVDIKLGTPPQVVTKEHGVFLADGIVLATPIEQTRRWLKLSFNKTPRAAWMYHLSGQVRPAYRHGDLHVFRSPNNNLFLSPQVDGTQLLYRLRDNRDFSELFEDSPVVISVRHWNPAFWMGGISLLDTHLGNGVYVAGDHNIIGMEDAFISGIAAATALTALSPNVPVTNK